MKDSSLKVCGSGLFVCPRGQEVPLDAGHLVKWRSTFGYNGTNGEHCAGGKKRSLRAKRNLQLARAVIDENNLFADSERKKMTYHAGRMIFS